jgi:hypothetical protein
MAPRALNVLQALLYVSCHVAACLAHIGVPGYALNHRFKELRAA